MNQKVLNILKVVGFFLLVVDLEAQEVVKIKELNIPWNIQNLRKPSNKVKKNKMETNKQKVK